MPSRFDYLTAPSAPGYDMMMKLGFKFTPQQLAELKQLQGNLANDYSNLPVDMRSADKIRGYRDALRFTRNIQDPNKLGLMQSNEYENLDKPKSMPRDYQDAYEFDKKFGLRNGLMEVDDSEDQGLKKFMGANISEPIFGSLLNYESEDLAPMLNGMAGYIAKNHLNNPIEEQVLFRKGNLELMRMIRIVQDPDKFKDLKRKLMEYNGFKNIGFEKEPPAEYTAFQRLQSIMKNKVDPGYKPPLTLEGLTDTPRNADSPDPTRLYRLRRLTKT